MKLIIIKKKQLIILNNNNNNNNNYNNLITNIKECQHKEIKYINMNVQLQNKEKNYLINKNMIKILNYLIVFHLNL